jgi:hypothetical protein
MRLIRILRYKGALSIERDDGRKEQYGGAGLQGSSTPALGEQPFATWVKSEHGVWRRIRVLRKQVLRKQSI